MTFVDAYSIFSILGYDIHNMNFVLMQMTLPGRFFNQWLYFLPGAPLKLMEGQK
jgi:hypothetical protein